MDFHSLTRKELQTLCKRNKIPANMTNVAMADALAALENVEGLEELMNQSQSPEKAVPESPSIPRTVTRTSTRRKPVKEDPETAQPTTRTRRTTRRTLDKDLDQENQNVNVPETPAVSASRRRAPAASATKKIDAQVEEDVGQEEVSGVVKTPAVQTARRRAQVGSARRKVEEGSVQQVHSTRRSVRLLEKTVADLSLNEKVKAESLKMDALDEIKEKDASAESLEKNKETVVSSGASFIESLEDDLELVDDVHKEDKSNDNEVENCELMSTQNSVNLDNHSVNAKDDDHDETCDKSDDLLGDNADRATSNDMGSVDVSVTEFVSETENASVEVEDSLAAKVSDETSAKVAADAVDVPVTEFESEPEKASVKVVMEAEESLAANTISVEQVDEVYPAELAQKDLGALLPGDKRSEDSELLDFKNPEADSDLFVSVPHAAAPNLQAANDECAEEENNYQDNDVAEPSSFDDANIEEFDAEVLIDVNLIESEEVPISYESEIAKLDIPDTNKEEFDTEGFVDVKLIEADLPMSAEDKTPNLNPDFENEEFDIEKGLVDANLAEAEVPMYSEDKTPKSAKQITPSRLGNVPVSSLPIESFSGHKIPGYCPVSGGKFSGKNPVSPLGADSFSSQFPRPTQSTPKLSSNKKQATAQKLTTIAEDNNKENIDTSGMQLESKKDKVKKNKNTINDDSLNDASLRQLTKMLREKLQITNKKMNNEEQNITQPQVVNKRPALQPVPENLVHPGEPKKEN